MNRFVNWYQNGYNSVNGKCFDIGSTIRYALEKYMTSGDPIAGSRDTYSAGNGSIMRLAPVAIRYASDLGAAKEAAYLQGVTTHGADECIDACALLAHVLVTLPQTGSLQQSLRAASLPVGTGIADLQTREYSRLSRDDVHSSGYVLHSLDAALWAVSNSHNPREALLLAANLGDDADTVAAITGQISGALWGMSKFPKEWINRLAWREQIVSIASDLFELSKIE